jgi:hypothetical protein
MQAEMPGQSSQFLQTIGTSNPKSSDILQTAIDLCILGDNAEEFKPAECDDEDLFRGQFKWQVESDRVEGEVDEVESEDEDLDVNSMFDQVEGDTFQVESCQLKGQVESDQMEGDEDDIFRHLNSMFDQVKGSGVELKSTKCDEESLKDLTNEDDLNGLEDSAEELKPPKDDRYLLKDVISVYDLSNCENNGDKLKPPKAENGDQCGGEFDSLHKNKDTMAQGTYRKRKLPSKHIEDQVYDFFSKSESGLQQLNKKKKKATAPQEKSRKRKSNSYQNNKEEKPLLDKKTRNAQSAKMYRINKTVDRRLLKEDISKIEQEIAALEKEIIYYKLPFSSHVVTQQDGSFIVNKGHETQTQLQQPSAELESWFQ